MSKTMAPIVVYQYYTALRLHFTSNYDFMKSQGRVKVTEDTFKRRNDCKFFYVLGNHEKPLDYMLANISENPKIYVRDLVTNQSECQERYKTYLRVRNSIQYNLKDDLKKLSGNIRDELGCDGHSLPVLFERVIRKEITKETYSIITQIADCYPWWTEQLEDNPFWKSEGYRLKKYDSFVQIKDNYYAILREKFGNSTYK